MWVAASQVRDHLLLITSSFADLTCVWNLSWTIYQRFSAKDFKLTQALLDYYWSRLLQEYDLELNERMMWQKSKWAGRKSHCVGAHGLRTQRHLRSWEDCESTQKFRRNSKELRHPDGYRSNPKTSSNPQPCIPTIVMCSEGQKLSLKRVQWNTRIQKNSLSEWKLLCCILLCLHFHLNCHVFFAVSVKESSICKISIPRKHNSPLTYISILPNPLISQPISFDALYI